MTPYYMNMKYYALVHTYKGIISALPVLLFLAVCCPCVCSGDEIKVSINIFNNLTFEQKNDWIGVSLFYDIAERLKKIQGVQLIGKERLNDIPIDAKPDFQDLSDDKKAIKDAKQYGAQYLVAGNFQILQDELTVFYRLIDLGSDKTVFTGFAKGYPDQIAEVEEKIGQKMIRSFITDFPGLKLNPSPPVKADAKVVHENYARGVTCSLKSEPQKAMDCFQKVIDGPGDFAPAYLGQGDIYLKEGNILMALERLNKALAIYQNEKDHFFVYLAQYKIAEAYFLQGDLEIAAGYYKRALDIKIEMKYDMHIPLIYSRLSRIEFRNGHIKKAVWYAKKAIKENNALCDMNRQVDYLINLADLYMYSGSLEEAGKTFAVALDTAKHTTYSESDRLDKFYSALQAKRQGSQRNHVQSKKQIKTSPSSKTPLPQYEERINDAKTSQP